MRVNKVWWFWIVDSVVVVSFAVIGRDSHGMGSDWSEVARISAPFLMGVGLATVGWFRWLSRRARTFDPLSVLSGLWMGVTTLVVGMLLRRFVFDDGTASIFVLITGAWITGLMVGWRLAVIGARSVANR